MKKSTPNSSEMVSRTSEVRVRFSETDPLGIVWHGRYLQYFEDGREEFGRAHGFSYLEQKEYGVATPIIRSSCEHKAPLRYGDIAQVRTTYVNTRAAKMVFQYEILNNAQEIVCTGETIQVFTELATGELQLTLPEFFRAWKEKMGLISE